MITCCKDCKKRYPGCHSVCPDYILNKKEHEERKEALRKDKLNTYDYYEGSMKFGKRGKSQF